MAKPPKAPIDTWRDLAAAELRGAILTNPHNPMELADTCYLALSMSSTDARARLDEAFSAVQHYDIDYWANDFLDNVDQFSRKPKKKVKLVGADSQVA